MYELNISRKSTLTGAGGTQAKQRPLALGMWKSYHRMTEELTSGKILYQRKRWFSV